ncbi:hypothetical protein DFH08DRAFT_1088608, partial [Mycena albidolilacea]
MSGGTEARRVRVGVCERGGTRGGTKEAPKEAEAKEEEPEDKHPKIRADCEASPACAPLKDHFEKCQEKVNAGEGYKGEDCVDEMCMSLCPRVCPLAPRRPTLSRSRCLFNPDDALLRSLRRAETLLQGALVPSPLFLMDRGEENDAADDKIQRRHNRLDPRRTPSRRSPGVATSASMRQTSGWNA